MAKYYYDKYQIIKYYKKTSSYGTEQAEYDDNWTNYLVLVHQDYYFSSSTGLFSGRGKSLETVYKVLGEPDYFRYYVTPRWVMDIDSAKWNNGVEIKGTKITSQQILKRGDLISENIIAENGTYPTNGRHSDGYWYVRGGLAFPEFKMRIGGVLKTSENGWVKINGQLREIDTIWTKINGALREVK